MSRSHKVFVFCVCACLIAAAASADIAIRLTNQQLTEESDLVVIGHATNFATRWIDRSLVTVVTVQISESLKGDLTDTVEVLLPGGVDANRRIPIAMTYPGAPQMQRDEQVFLFLTYDADVSGHIVSGFAQGKFSIVTQQGREMVSRDLRGSQLVEGTGITRGTTTLLPLSDFRQEVLTYLGR